MATPDRSAVEQQLDRILASSRFASSERLSTFLRFVVQSALDGTPGRTKEVVIATEVYRRGPEYDPQVDSTVRADASRLRARLREYYATTGLSDPVLIEIFKGSYTPNLSFRTIAPLPAPPAVPPAAERPRLSPWLLRGVIAAIAGILAVAAWLWTTGVPARRPSPAQLEEQARQLVPSVGDHLLRAAQPEPEYPLEVLLKAAQLFEQAAAVAPARGGAWAGAAQTYQLAASYDHRYIAKARDAARRSVELDPANPEGHYMDAYLRFFEDWDFAGAQQGFGRSIELQPHWEAAYRHFSDAASLGRQFSAADANLKAGLRIFPGSPLLLVSQAMLRFYEGRLDEMLALGKQLPESLDLAFWVRGLALEQKGDLPGARQALQRCLHLSPRNVRCAIALVHLEARAGDALHADARAAVLADRDGEMTITRVYQHAGLRDRTRTLEWIERGIAQHDNSIIWVLIDPRFSHLRPDPQFRLLAQRITSPQ